MASKRGNVYCKAPNPCIEWGEEWEISILETFQVVYLRYSASRQETSALSFSLLHDAHCSASQIFMELLGIAAYTSFTRRFLLFLLFLRSILADQPNSCHVYLASASCLAHLDSMIRQGVNPKRKDYTNLGNCPALGIYS
jgi:hypothetical protein